MDELDKNKKLIDIPPFLEESEIIEVPSFLKEETDYIPIPLFLMNSKAQPLCFRCQNGACQTCEWCESSAQKCISGCEGVACEGGQCGTCQVTQDCSQSCEEDNCKQSPCGEGCGTCLYEQFPCEVCLGCLFIAESGCGSCEGYCQDTMGCHSEQNTCRDCEYCQDYCQIFCEGSCEQGQYCENGQMCEKAECPCVICLNNAESPMVAPGAGEAFSDLIKARQWNDAQHKVNTFRHSKGYARFQFFDYISGENSFSKAVVGQPFTKSHFNQIINALSGISGVSSLPSKKRSGDICYATDFNTLLSAINMLKI